MTWFRVDDGWYSHPKTLHVGLAARGLWASCGSWCGKQENDGVVPEVVLPMCAPRVPLSTLRKLAAELVAAGLWEVVPGGWLFHDWEVMQPTRAEKDAERAENRRRQAEWRERKRREREERENAQLRAM
jgi:hypothetical protein